MKGARKLRDLQQPRSLIGNVRQSLTPRVWKQARQAVPRGCSVPRWDLQPWVLIMMAMTGAAGDSQSEKFGTARGSYVACDETRKRPGRTLQRFQKALCRVPVPVRQLKALAAGGRQELRARLATRLLVDGFEPMGCDGSRIECPRSAALEARRRHAGNDDAAPTVWVTAFVPLSTGLLGSWQLGPGTADGRDHLRQLLKTLSPQALIVGDAAYMGYELVRAILQAHRSFLFRMSSKVHLSTLEGATLKGWTEGPVSYGPAYAQAKGIAPIHCRLTRVPATGKTKRDVWLLTDILDPARRAVATAATFYRRRWRNEGVSRTSKRTVNQLKLSSRTGRPVHREAEVSLLAPQLLLAHADLALRSNPTATAGQPVISPRKVLIEIRRERNDTANRRIRSYRERLQDCRADDRKPTSPKATREWPRRKPPKPPKPPVLHTLTEEQNALLDRHMDAAGRAISY